MMKNLIYLVIFSAVSFSLFSKDKVKNIKKAPVEDKKVIIESAKPCDSKEDLLKKLEEKKKEEIAPKAFSLQGGDTGCKVK